ncbi:MAG: type IX secretion system ring subunit PorN/GldN [Flavobacteriales bacterium]|jgi:gliding motility associated protien GldN|nr:gliding motility protein GldN [Bacteroidota bacterium]MDA0980104.1 gliding motility protein GldN [Bacteroidota bacterium]|tara:strand:- start:2616 stop:3473 length:858 start_codon:yes stop_codon:yes gene_type:complete
MSNLFKYTLLAIALITLSMEGNAQVQNVLDGAYVKETNLTKRVIPYPYLREADVMYFKRIWQEMDLKQKINHPYYYPVDPIEDRSNLFDVIRDGLLIEGSLVAYSTGAIGDEDEFTIPLSPDSIRSILNPIERIDDWDEFGEKIGFKEIITPIESDKITRYRLKEDWIWDRQRSERYVRIIGIAPMIEDYDNDGESIGFAPLFWLYYPECRYVFANADVFNLFNDAQRRTYEDLFQKRYFSSYIVKEANVYDRSIVEFARGMDALAESERIKEELFNLEHDLWHY